MIVADYRIIAAVIGIVSIAVTLYLFNRLSGETTEPERDE